MENNTPKNTPKDTSRIPSGPILCTGCMTFYANSELNGLCSGCYKSENSGNLPAKPKKTEVKPAISAIEETKPICEQKNHKFCWDCKKKVGLFGYKCKCQYTYCGMHRLPEDHECEFDHVAVGKKLLDKKNPVLIGKKMNGI